MSKTVSSHKDNFIDDFHYALRKSCDTRFSGVAWNVWHLDSADLFNYLTAVFSLVEFENLDLCDAETYLVIFSSENSHEVFENYEKIKGRKPSTETRVAAMVMSLIDKETARDLASFVKYS